MSQRLLADLRQAAAKSCDEQVTRLAVVVHVRQTETRYDELLASGYERWEALSQVEGTVAQVLAAWESPERS